MIAAILISALILFYVLCFQWDRVVRFGFIVWHLFGYDCWDWFLSKWPFMTVKRHVNDVEATILLCEALYVMDEDRISLDWPLDPDLQSIRQARIERAKRDEQWKALMTCGD